MSAVLRKSLADLRRRKVQTVVIGLVLLLSSLAATMALTLLVESDAPFDHAFAQANGAHLTMTFAAVAVSEDQLRSTGRTAGVGAFAGPWPVVPWSIDDGGRTFVQPLAGRDSPGGPVDRLTIAAGRWAARGNEVVLSQRLADSLGASPGSSIAGTSDSPIPTMTVVGIASGVGQDVAAWTVPAGVPIIRSGKPQTAYLMAYRLVHASSQQDIATVSNTISASIGQGGVLDSSSYLDAKLNADRTTAVMIPFLLAFSAFALVASALIIGNLVGGAVIAGTRDIGIMKSVGFTPGQVVMVLAGQMLIPAFIGCLVGVPLGILASQPFLADTAHAFGLPQTFGIAPGPDALGVAAILVVVIGATVAASLRAGRMTAASAIATGTAPSSGHGYRSARLAARLPIPRPWSLGSGESLARPVRSAMTVVAIVIGVATVTFALGLSRSLNDVQAGLTRTHQVQVSVSRPAAGGGNKGGVPVLPSGLTDQQVSDAIAAQPGTARSVAERTVDVTVVGAGHPVPLTAYRGDSSWLGYPIINGRWFATTGEAVVPTAFLSRTGHHLGDTITATLDGQGLRLKLVGEIFDMQGDNVLLRSAWGTLPGSPEATDYEIQLKPGTHADAFGAALQAQSSLLDVRLNDDHGSNTAFLLINSVLAGLALILAVIALSGVFNTVVLNTREKARDIAILKALGMAPGEVVGMVLASVGLLGLAAVALGIPSGIALHRNILMLMGQIASGTGIPVQYFHVFDLPLLLGLAAAGILIAMLGALVPAQWAARSSITEVLQTE